MSLEYSLIIPYSRTPTITRLALHSLSQFCTGVPEIFLIHHDPDPSAADTALFAEFPTVHVLHQPSTLHGSAAHFAALDAGLAAASHDLVGFLHSDTLLLKPSWDEDLFGYMERDHLDALGTRIQEANPFRPWQKHIVDIWREVWHKRRPRPKDSGELMLYFLLTRKSVLAKMDHRFTQQGALDIGHYTRAKCMLGLLSQHEVNDFMWHISNTTRLLCEDGADPKLWQEFQQKWQTFWQNPYVANQFSAFGNPVAGLTPASESRGMVGEERGDN